MNKEGLKKKIAELKELAENLPSVRVEEDIFLKVCNLLHKDIITNEEAEVIKEYEKEINGHKNKFKSIVETFQKELDVDSDLFTNEDIEVVMNYRKNIEYYYKNGLMQYELIRPLEGVMIKKSVDDQIKRYESFYKEATNEKDKKIYQAFIRKYKDIKDGRRTDWNIKEEDGILYVMISGDKISEKCYRVKITRKEDL